MEPLFFKAENIQGGTHANHRHHRFNGAAFFQSGKLRFVNRATQCQRRASMEPLFFKAENTACACVNAGSSGFNGAAFFQSGK